MASFPQIGSAADLRGVAQAACGLEQVSSTGPVPADQAVREFYDAHPYPPPITDLERHRELYRNPQRRRALFHLFWRPVRSGRIAISWLRAAVPPRPPPMR